MVDDVLAFYSEVRVTAPSERKEFKGYVGAILGVSGESDENGEYHYAVKLDQYDNVVGFCGSELTTTGSMRDRGDYY